MLTPTSHGASIVSVDDIKHCSGCETDKPLLAFNRGQGWCRDCQKAYRRQNAAKIRELNRNYQARNRDKVNQWNRECHARRIELRRQQSRAKYLKYREKIRKRHKEWREKNRAKSLQYWHAHRTRKFGPDADLTAEQWLVILNTAGHKCVYCGTTEALEVEHIVPVSRGGRHTASNVEPACRRCNGRKSNKTKEEFLAFLVKHALTHL